MVLNLAPINRSLHFKKKKKNYELSLLLFHHCIDLYRQKVLICLANKKSFENCELRFCVTILLTNIRLSNCHIKLDIEQYLSNCYVSILITFTFFTPLNHNIRIIIMARAEVDEKLLRKIQSNTSSKLSHKNRLKSYSKRADRYSSVWSCVKIQRNFRYIIAM